MEANDIIKYLESNGFIRRDLDLKCIDFFAKGIDPKSHKYNWAVILDVDTCEIQVSDSAGSIPFDSKIKNTHDLKQAIRFYHAEVKITDDEERDVDVIRDITGIKGSDFLKQMIQDAKEYSELLNNTGSDYHSKREQDQIGSDNQEDRERFFFVYYVANSDRGNVTGVEYFSSYGFLNKEVLYEYILKNAAEHGNLIRDVCITGFDELSEADFNTFMTKKEE